MPNYTATIGYSEKDNLSFSAIAIILVFFLVTSQIFILPLPSIATQLFRPLLIIMCLIHMGKRGNVQQKVRTFSFLVAIHALLVLLFYWNLWSMDTILEGGAVALFFLMFSVSIGVNWSRQELRWILFACFLGSFVCSVALLLSNDPTDLNAATAGHLKLVSAEVNRNKNAYQYSFGVILGMIYLMKGKRNPKALFFLMTAVTGYALLYSQCRGAFFSFVSGATVLLVGLLLEVKRKNGRKAFAWFLVMIATYVAAYYLLKNSELSRLVDGETTSGRDEGIEAAWRLFLNSDWFCKLFGNGFGFETMQTGEIGAHNVFVGCLVSMGIIGAGLTALVFAVSLKNTIGVGAYALFVAAFMKTMFEGADYNVFIPLILSVIISNYMKITGKRDYDLFSR